MGRVSFWLLVAATLGIYLAMVTWSLPRIADEAGGLPPFDLRPTGYTFEEARAFLVALTPQGGEFYRTTQHALDLLFPGLLAATLYWAIVILLPARLGGWRFVLAVPVLLTAYFDWSENAAVDGLLTAGAQAITPEAVAAGSRLSIAKAASSTIAYLALIGLLVWHGYAWMRRSRARA